MTGHEIRREFVLLWLVIALICFLLMRQRPGPEQIVMVMALPGPEPLSPVGVNYGPN